MPDSPLRPVQQLKDAGTPITALTAFDYPSARFVDEAGIDLILVGDSLGMTVLGYEDTTSVTLDEMLHHLRACRRAVKRAPLVADLPYRTYDDPDQAQKTARALADNGADAVKLEGGQEIREQIRAVASAGIPLVGHVGMLPQQIRSEGRYRKKGKTAPEAERIFRDAELLEEEGAAAIVLESIVPNLARRISEARNIPTIGIGSGLACGGQILVLHDLLGAFPWFRPSFAIPRADVAEETRRAIRTFIANVRDTDIPAPRP